MTLAPGVSGNAIWWHEGTIRAVGDATDLERRVPTRVPRYVFPSAIVTPGFVDGHTHFVLWALGRHRVSLVGARTLAEALRRIAEGVPEDGWVRGHGWDANRWRERPDRLVLDSVTSGPAFFESVDVHAGWANSAALELAGVERGTPDPPGGRIVRDGNGVPTGLLLERAMELVTRVLPPPAPARVVEALRHAQGQAHRLGLTGIHDIEADDALSAFRTLEAADELRLRVMFSPPIQQLPVLQKHRVHSGEGSTWLRLGGVKLFLDGTLGSRTAWMLDAYEDGADRGMPLATEAEARRAVTAAGEAGLASVVHAIGDAAVRRALDLLADAPRVAIPHRIEHCQCVDDADLGRAAARGIVMSMQPGHLPGDVALAEERWGRRSRGAYSFRRLLERGTVLAFGSDVPVVSCDPRVGVAAAMDRIAADGGFPHGWYPGERLGFEEAVSAYTLGNAVAAGLEEYRGRLAPGFDADLVAWECDPGVEEGIGAAFRSARVRLTLVAGEAVYAPAP